MPVDDYVFDEIEEFSSPLGGYFLTKMAKTNTIKREITTFPSPLGDYFFKRGDYKMMLHEALERRFRPH